MKWRAAVAAAAAVAFIIARYLASHRKVVAGGMAAMSLAGGGISVFVGAPSTPSVCDRNASTSTFATQVSAATAGQTICLASGSYGTWAGTNKAITITPQAGASPTMALNFGSGDTGFTIDGGRDAYTSPTGLTITGGDIVTGTTNITVRDSDFTGGVTIDGPTNSNMLFDHNQHHDVRQASNTAAFHLAYGASLHSGVTIQNSLFRDMDADGIQAGPAVNILNNKFLRVDVTDPEQHTDAIQLLSGSGSNGIGSTIRGNWVDDCEQAISGFDGMNNALIEHNVVTNCRAHMISLYGDSPASTVQFNTIIDGGLTCGAKSTEPASITRFRNNIADGGIDLNGGVKTCVPTENTKNLFPGGGGTNLNGSATFVGGAHPTTFAGFALAPSSAGKSAATDGTDVGVFGAGFTGGPPTS